MILQVLAAIKAQVRVVNSQESWMPEPIELWFPHMYSDGKWACSLIFSKVVDSRIIMKFIPMLEGFGCYWFVHEMNGDIAIDIM